jgi:hypothetical protein
MNKKEIIERYSPRKVDSQQEYDHVFALMNAEQAELNQPYADRDTALAIELNKLEEKRLFIAQQMNKIKTQRLELNQERKEINRLFHELKHQWAVLNPKEPCVPQDGNERTTDEL